MDLHAGTPQNDLHTNNIKKQIKHHGTRILQYCSRNSMIFHAVVFHNFLTIIHPQKIFVKRNQCLIEYGIEFFIHMDIL